MDNQPPLHSLKYIEEFLKIFQTVFNQFHKKLCKKFSLFSM